MTIITVIDLRVEIYMWTHACQREHTQHPYQKALVYMHRDASRPRTLPQKKTGITPFPSSFPLPLPVHACLQTDDLSLQPHPRPPLCE